MLTVSSRRKAMGRRALLGTVSGCLLAVLAWQSAAQTDASQAAPSSTSSATTPQEKKPGNDKTPRGTTTVTVTGKKPQNRIDRQVYDVTKNVDAETGTAADALNKVPGVNVDPSGNVTLHGHNAVIYLNGRPSLMLSGDNRGVALQSMPSAYISSIEVISNPGAQYSSGNSDPIINIVTKRTMPPGYYGSLSAQWRSEGGGLGTAYLSVNRGKLSLTFIASESGDSSKSRSSSVSTDFDDTGAVIQKAASSGQARTSYRGPFVTTNFQYDLDANNILAGQANFNRTAGHSYLSDWTATTSANGSPLNVFNTTGVGAFVSDNAGLAMNYTHYGKKPDETLKVDANLERQEARNTSHSDDNYLFSDVPTNMGTRAKASDRDNVAQRAALHAEYNTPVGDDQLTLGSEITDDDVHTKSQAFGPGAPDTDLAVNPLLNDDFRSHVAVSAIYGTYQRELARRWTVLVGLRGEALNLSTDDLTYRTIGKMRYTRLNPSVFATYVLSPKQKLRFSYTHRQHRPEAVDLNSHIVYSSDTSVNVGNPGLMPEETDSFEARYEYEGKILSYAFRGFYRRNYRTIVPISQVIPDPQNAGYFVTETTETNFSHQTASGVTATVSKQISGKLMLNGDATATFDQVRNPLILGVQSGTSLNGSVSLNYLLFKGDQLFLRYKLVGKAFTGQGYKSGYGQGSIQYNHKLTRTVSLTFSIDDPFRETKTQSVIDTPTLHRRFVNSRQAPTFMVGLSRRFSNLKLVPQRK